MHINVLEYLERSCAADPEAVAVADADSAYTYAALRATVRAVGAALTRLLGVRDRPIAVLTRRRAADLALMLGVVCSGNCYAPIDAETPEKRRRQILEILRPAAVLSAVPDAAAGPVPLLTLDELRGGPVPETLPWRSAKDTDPLYVIFTSGSTGEPKGVTVSHRSVIDMAEQFCAVFGFRPDSVFGGQAPFDFDISVKDIYLSLKLGARLELLEKRLFSFPGLLVERMNERGVTEAIWSVSAMKIIAELDGFGGAKPETLRDVLFSGELMPQKTLRYWTQRLPGRRWVNLYGPTEITCNCTYHVLSADDAAAERLPIGRAFPNCSVFLLDGDAPVTEEERIGEICVSGSCLALGYYDRPELTAAVFCRNPLQRAWPERIYRTGDLGFFRGGALYFAGRRDSQIKYMGHRIELGEIELCANAAPGVTASACVYDGEAARLGLYYTGTAAPGELYAHLRERLPRYMLPRKPVQLPEFPVNRTGKIDRAALLRQMRGE